MIDSLVFGGRVGGAGQQRMYPKEMKRVPLVKVFCPASWPFFCKVDLGKGVAPATKKKIPSL